MYPDLDTLVTALYVTADDLLADLGHRRGPGRPPELTDAELICLAVAQVHVGCNSERRWIRMVHSRMKHLFPYVPQQSGYNKRLRAATELLKVIIAALVNRTPSSLDRVRLLDSTPIPCGASRETVKRSALADCADYGYCASHSRWFWGLRLYLLTTPDGLPSLWCLASPKLGEREVAQAMLASDKYPGLIIVADKGFAGSEFEEFVRQSGATLVRPDRRDEKNPRWGALGWIRQRIESVNQSLKGQLGLEDHGGRTAHGVLARVAQRLLALTAGIWLNWLYDLPDKRSLIAYDH